jgi:hypothetical protein
VEPRELRGFAECRAELDGGGGKRGGERFTGAGPSSGLWLRGRGLDSDQRVDLVDQDLTLCRISKRPDERSQLVGGGGRDDGAAGRGEDRTRDAGHAHKDASKPGECDFHSASPMPWRAARGAAAHLRQSQSAVQIILLQE